MTEEMIQDMLEENSMSAVELYWIMEHNGYVGPQELVNVIETHCMEDELAGELSMFIEKEDDLKDLIDEHNRRWK